MVEVIQFCIDAAKSSGVNYFCTQLNEALNATGEVRSAVVRSVEELEGFLDVGLRRRRTAELRTSNIILHLHGIWKRPQHQAARWAKAHGVPIVWSTHGMTAPWSMRHKWWKKLPAWWLYQKRDLKSAKVIHCTTETEAEWNRELLGFKVSEVARFVVAPLGCGEKVSGFQSFNVSEAKPFVALFVGRVHPVKGLENLIRAVREVEKFHCTPTPMTYASERKVELRIVGPDEDGYLQVLETLCEKLGVTNVAFAGEKHGEELSAEYEGCDMLVLPSFTENFGGVVVDALAHGKPVIASKATPWRVLEESRCGWWVENDPDTLAKTIREAAELPRETLRKMGENGKELVKAKYTWDAVAKTMCRCYREVIGE